MSSAHPKSLRTCAGDLVVTSVINELTRAASNHLFLHSDISVFMNLYQTTAWWTLFVHSNKHNWNVYRTYQTYNANMIESLEDGRLIWSNFCVTVVQYNFVPWAKLYAHSKKHLRCFMGRHAMRKIVTLAIMRKSRITRHILPSRMMKMSFVTW